VAINQESLDVDGRTVNVLDSREVISYREDCARRKKFNKNFVPFSEEICGGI
jgi:hypothetical protein